MNVEAIVIPVRVDTTGIDTARQHLTAGNAPGGPGSPAGSNGAAPAGASSGPGITPGEMASIRGVLREFGQLEQVLKSVNLGLREFHSGLGGGTAPAVAPAPPGAPHGPTRPHGGKPHGDPAEETADKIADAMREKMQEAITGLLGVVGLGLGLEAATDHLREMRRETTEYDIGIAKVAASTGIGPEGYDAMHDAGLDRTTPTFVTPREATRMSERMLRAGVYAEEEPAEAGRKAMTDSQYVTGPLGRAARGSTEGGAAFVETIASAFRNPQAGNAIMAEQIQEARDTKRGIGESVLLLDAIVRLERQSVGQGAQTNEQLGQMMNLQTGLAALPGGIGEGAGGADLAKRISGAAQHGIGFMMQLDDWTRQNKRPPKSDEDWLDVYMQVEDPKRSIPAAQRSLAANKEGATSTQLAFLAQAGMGTTFAQGKVLGEDPEKAAEGFTERDRHLTPEHAAHESHRQLEEGAEKPGGQFEETEAALKKMQSAAEGLAKTADAITQFYTDHPWLTMAGETAGGAVTGLAAGAAAGAIGGLSQVLFSKLFAGATVEAVATAEAAAAAGASPLVAAIFTAIVGGVAGYGVGSVLESKVDKVQLGIWGDYEHGKHEDWKRGPAGQLRAERAARAAADAAGGPTAPSDDYAAHAAGVGVPPSASAASGGAYAGIRETRPGHIDPYDPLIEAAAKKYGENPATIRAVMEQENGFRLKGTSSAGAQGPMQIMPFNWPQYGNGGDINDPKANIDAGVHIFSDNRKRALAQGWTGDEALRRAAMGYHGGERGMDNPNNHRNTGDVSDLEYGEQFTAKNKKWGGNEGASGPAEVVVKVHAEDGLGDLFRFSQASEPPEYVRGLSKRSRT